MDLRVMLWDVRVGGARKLPLVERIDADLVLLLGVSRASSRAWTQRWQGRYHCAAGLDLTESPQRRPHGAMVASRWPLHDARVVPELPLPERGLIATVAHPVGNLTVVSWGTPNAAGDTRPVKAAAYRHMTGLLLTLPKPLIVGIDTNSWYDPPTPDSVVETDLRWADEHGFLQRNPAHGLVDVHRALVDAEPARSRLLAYLYPHGPLATTFIRRPHRRPRGISRGFDAGLAFGLDRMDRIFVSDDLTPLACEHLYHESLDVGGDHAAVVADLSISSG